MSILGRRSAGAKYTIPNDYPGDRPKNPKRQRWYADALRASILAGTCPLMVTEEEARTAIGGRVDALTPSNFVLPGARDRSCLYRAADIREILASSSATILPFPNPSVSAALNSAPATTGGENAQPLVTGQPTPSAHPAAVSRAVKHDLACRCTGHSRLTGEKITCGHCDRRKPRPHLVVPSSERCPYCGVAGSCGCPAIRAKIVASGENRDDQILVQIHRGLVRADRDRMEQAIADEKRAARIKRLESLEGAAQ